jgi:hypothetical protein
MTTWKVLPPNATKNQHDNQTLLAEFVSSQSNANVMSLFYSTSFNQKDGEKGYPYHLHDKSSRITRGNSSRIHPSKDLLVKTMLPSF